MKLKSDDIEVVNNTASKVKFRKLNETLMPRYFANHEAPLVHFHTQQWAIYSVTLLYNALNLQNS